MNPIVTQHRLCHFGIVKNGKMTLSAEGRIAEDILNKITDRCPYLIPYNHVVMPNHVHLLVGVNIDNAPRNSRANDIDDSDATFRDWLGTLSLSVRQIKAKISFEIHKINRAFAWQRSFHDHVIRDERTFNMIYEYISHNPERWSEDVMNDEK